MRSQIVNSSGEPTQIDKTSASHLRSIHMVDFAIIINVL